MGLQGDLEELKQAWPNLPLTFKVFLLVSFILSCFSITSLADSVYEFKGFIREAVTFYQETISPVFTNILSYLGLAVSQAKLDVILFITLVSTSIIRADFLYRNRIEVTLIDFITWFGFVYLAYHTPDKAVYGIVYGYYGVVIFFAALPSIFHPLKKYKSILSYRLALTNVLAVLFLVSIAAALSEGLNREML